MLRQSLAGQSQILRKQIIGSEQVGYDIDDRFQNLVAKGMTVSIIQTLEVIQVEFQYCQLAIITSGPDDLGFGSHIKVSPV